MSGVVFSPAQTPLKSEDSSKEDSKANTQKNSFDINHYIKTLDPLIEKWLKKEPLKSGEEYTFTLKYNLKRYYGAEKSNDRKSGCRSLQTWHDKRVARITYQKNKLAPPAIPASGFNTYLDIIGWMKKNPLPENLLIQIHLQPGFKTYLPVNLQADPTE